MLKFAQITHFFLLSFFLYAGCNSDKNEKNIQAAECIIPPTLFAMRDTFNIEKIQKLKTIPKKYWFSFMQKKKFLQNAYVIGGSLQDSVPSVGGDDFFYCKSRILNQSPRKICHFIVNASDGEFDGLFLVIYNHEKISNLYLAGSYGSSDMGEEWMKTAPETKGYIISDSTIIIKTGRTAYAIEGTNNISYTDTITSIYKIDYSNTIFVLNKKDSVRIILPGIYFP